MRYRERKVITDKIYSKKDVLKNVTANFYTILYTHLKILTTFFIKLAHCLIFSGDVSQFKVVIMTLCHFIF